MATRSFIARYNPDTEDYTAIYCHWDGYPTGVGVTLRDHYNIDEKVSFLMAQGDISSLRESVVETAEEAYSVRGDTNTEATTHKYRHDMFDDFRNRWCEYGYIWKDGVWECVSLNPEYINLYADHLTNEAANV